MTSNDVSKLGVVDPVPRGIQRQGKLTDSIFNDFVIELEQDTETSVYKDDMCMFGENMIAGGKAFFSCCQSFRCQELLD